jgi:RNA polymerase sigma-70 factor (ECF subfamily)
MPKVAEWLARWCVPAADRGDVGQDALLRAYQCRDSYDPARGRQVAWAYGIFCGVVRNYRKARGRRTRRVDVAVVDLPDVAVDAPSPEEGTDEVMSYRLLERCLATLNPDSRAILLAKDRDGIPMPAIAAAHGIAESTARVYYKEARAQLEAALAQETRRKRALGVAVLPLSLDQLIASDGRPAHVDSDTMARIWKALDRRMAVDKAAGRLGDDGTAVERYMGVPNPVPRVGPLVRAVRALLDPRVLPSLTGLVGALGGALVTYAIMRAPPQHHHDTAVAATVHEAAAASVARLLGPAPIDAPPAERGAPAQEAPELHADARVVAVRASVSAPPLHVDAHSSELRPDAGPMSSAAARDDIAAEQAAYLKGSAFYQGGKYGLAIDAFEAHAREYPRGRFSSQRDRLWTLALIYAGRTAEARERIERLRQTSPDNPVLKEFDEALSQHK